MQRAWIVTIAVCVGAWSWGAAHARVKLITLPARVQVEIRMDNPGATLVEEERLVPLVKGRNQVDFSWHNTQIDPGSIVFRVVGGDADGARVLSVSYPPNEQALIWSIYAPKAGSARVRISYLLGGLERSFNYRANASKDESTLTLSRYLRVRNNANEAFESSGIWIAGGTRITRPVGVAQTREVLVNRWDDVPLVKTYSVNLTKTGWQDAGKKELRVAMHYKLENKPRAGLGDAVLSPGKARIYQADGKGGLIFVGEDWAKRTPPGDEMSLYLGVARDVVVKRTIEANERTRIDGNLFNHSVTLKFEIENFKREPVVLDVIEELAHLRGQMMGAQSRPIEWVLGPESDFPGGVDPQKTRDGQVLVHAPLPAADENGKAKKIVRRLQVIFKNEW
jgi:hypothetical protein